VNVTVFAGDIAEAPADVICTSTNPRLSLIMGTGASVREKGGFGILRECEAILAASGRASLPAGSVHVTSAGTLPYKAVIHCVAGNDAHRSSEAIVRVCAVNALRAAASLGAESIAIPILGSGHAHVKLDRAVAAIADAIQASDVDLATVVLVVLDPSRLDVVRQVLADHHLVG
jgi:O-acetyl-ADP-ribose deacetylase